MSNLRPDQRSFTIGGPAARRVLWICSLLWMVNFMDRQVAAVVLEPLRIDLALTDAQAGWLTTAMYLGLAVLAIPVAALADRTGRRRAIVAMAVVWSAATLATGLCSDPVSLALARAATGAGEAGFSAACLALISASTLEHQRAAKLGLFNLFQVVGIAAGAALAGLLSGRFGWRVPFLVFALPGFILAGLALTMQDYQSPPRAARMTVIADIRALLAVRTLRWFYAGQTAFTAMVYAVLSWSPTLLMRYFAIDEATAGNLVAISGTTAVPGAIIGGVCSDRWQRRHPAGRLRFAAVAALAMTLGLGVAIPIALWQGSLPALSTPWIVVSSAGWLVFCVAAASVTPAAMAASQSVVTAERKSLVWGLGITLVLVCGAAWLPLVVGRVSDALGGGAPGLGFALLGASGLGIAAALCYLAAGRAYPADHARVAPP